MNLFKDSNPWKLNPMPVALLVAGLAITCAAAGRMSYKPDYAWWWYVVLSIGGVALIVATGWMSHEKADLDDVIAEAEKKDEPK